MCSSIISPRLTMNSGSFLASARRASINWHQPAAGGTVTVCRSGSRSSRVYPSVQYVEVKAEIAPEADSTRASQGTASNIPAMTAARVPPATYRAATSPPKTTKSAIVNTPIAIPAARPSATLSSQSSVTRPKRRWKSVRVCARDAEMFMPSRTTARSVSRITTEKTIENGIATKPSSTASTLRSTALAVAPATAETTARAMTPPSTITERSTIATVSNLTLSTGQNVVSPARQAKRRENGRSASCSALALINAPSAMAESRNRPTTRPRTTTPARMRSMILAPIQVLTELHTSPGVAFVAWLLLFEEPLKVGALMLTAPSPAKKASNHKYL